MYGLGRLHAPDTRDLNYPIEAQATERTYRFWNAYDIFLDQGQTPQCTAFAWMHFYVDSPKKHYHVFEKPAVFYNQEQKIDGFPMPHDGSTVRAGAKVLKSGGHCTSYKWAFTLDSLVNCILTQGPVVVGTNWYDSMFDPVSGNYVRITPNAGLAGGHAYKLDGVNTSQKYFRLKNSWGKSWGNSGFAKISFNDMTRLIHEDGEACLAVE